jgi:hypothetical protein
MYVYASIQYVHKPSDPLPSDVRLFCWVSKLHCVFAWARLATSRFDCMLYTTTASLATIFVVGLLSTRQSSDRLIVRVGSLCDDGWPRLYHHRPGVQDAAQARYINIKAYDFPPLSVALVVGRELGLIVLLVEIM